MYPKIDNFFYQIFVLPFTALYLLSVFFSSNMSLLGSVFDVNVSCIVSCDFNNYRSFLIFLRTHFMLMLTLNCKFYDHNFHSKPESNSDNFNLDILISVFSLIFYLIFLKHGGELRIEYLNFLFEFQCSMLSKASTIQSFVTV